ncbi:MAG: hypothetical protein KatS3mg115_0540 [Candidatus Poribacteria bacterium]|nr:MAG: hypothetical protein KatS3mg115_0540 [Candidatus Poribacteria bacterium]
MIEAYLKYLWNLIWTPNGLLTVGTILGVVWLYRLYSKRMEIPGLTIEVLGQESWFVHRDDNHRMVIVLSLRLQNRSGQEVQIERMRFSGYAPVEKPTPIVLEGKRNSVPLPYPGHEFYSGREPLSIPPYSERTVWVCFESRVVDLKNRIAAPLVLRSKSGHRNSVRVQLARHPYQIQLYYESWL